MNPAYTHTVTQGLLDPPTFNVLFNGRAIFQWPAALIQSTQHDAMCYKIAMLHEMAQRQAREELQTKLCNLLGAATPDDINRRF